MQGLLDSRKQNTISGLVEISTKQERCDKRPCTHPTLKNIAGYKVNVLVMFCEPIGSFPQKEYKMMSQYVMSEIQKRVGFFYA